MEPPIKSSFIPKKPVAPVSMRQARSRPLGLLFFGASVLLVAAFLMSGGIFGYTELLKREITDKSQRLEQARRDLQPAIIEELRRVNARLTHTQTVLANHLTLSPVFTLLEESTLQNVQYTNFVYLFNPEGGVSVDLEGRAASFKSLALQADALNNNPTFLDARFSNLSVDEFGNVTFKLNVEIDSATVAYGNLIKGLEDTQIQEDVRRETESTTASSTEL